MLVNITIIQLNKHILYCKNIRLFHENKLTLFEVVTAFKRVNTGIYDIYPGYYTVHMSLK